MNEVLNNVALQYGFMGICFAGVVFAVKYMINQLKVKENEKNAIEVEFREHLINNEKNNMLIIQGFTTAVNGFTDALQSVISTNERLVDVINEKQVICKIHDR